MTTYRVIAEANSVPITTEVEAVSEEHAWVVACNKFSSVRLYNGKVEELPTRSELLARIQELETFAREVANDDLDRVSGGIKDKAAALLDGGTK